MNSAIASSINGGDISNLQVANGSYSSLLLSSVEFSLTEVKTNSSSATSQGKYLIKLTGKEELLNGHNKLKILDQNKNSIENSSLFVNGNVDKCSEDGIPTPKVQLYSGKIYVHWNKVHKIGAGLINFGNTCFMNTVLQCLTYCPPLVNYLLYDNDHSSKCTTSGFCMMCVLQRHMRIALGNSGHVIAPSEISKKLRLIAKHFQYGHQEDAHEYLRYVIDHLWKACVPQNNGVSKLDPASKETTVINKIFGGYHRSQVICTRCKKESNTYDHFMEFMLDIKQNVTSLIKALEKFTQSELLQQDNCYKCPKCKMKVVAQKRFTVYQAPIVATFQLKRFGSFGGKITKHIHYPEKLDLRPYMSDTKGEAVLYCLNAVLVHSGNSCNSGHYFCYVKNSVGHWYLMNDEKVQKVGINQVLDQCAYVLFYIRMKNTESTPLKKNLEIKHSIMKGTVSNSHFSRVSETNGLKPSPLNDKASKTPKLSSSPNSLKKIDLSTTHREKISFGFRTKSTTPLVTPPKSRISSSETVSVSRGALVPYVKDSSESSDGGESNSDFKPPSKQKSFEDHQTSSLAAAKDKPSKSPVGPSQNCAMQGPAVKVNATGSWIVTDVPQTPSSSSSSNGVNSTTDWQVIEASDTKSGGRKESSDSERSLQVPRTPERSSNCDNLAHPSLSLEKSPSSNNGNSPLLKSNFRKQAYDGKSEEIVSPFKRKFSDSPSKTSNDSSYFNHKESRCSPVPKKFKSAENSSFLNQESDFRNSNPLADDTGDSATVQKDYPNCDIRSRTSVVNGVSGPADTFGDSPSKNALLNGSVRDKDDIFSKGKQEKSFTESKSEKLLISNQERNTSLYGPEVPTWREENHHRPSVYAHERRSFDDYDKDFDSGKMRKSKLKNQNQFFHSKNPFQTYSECCNRKYNGKYRNNHYYHRRHDSNRGWKSNHSNNYSRYRNNQRRY